jgi:predicted restriction endonuclease
MGIDTSMLKYGKPVPRVVEKRDKRLTDAQREKACREEVWKRFGRHCCVPGCREQAIEQHHIVYRSRSVKLKYEPTNRAPLCTAHHQLLHAGKITIERDAAGCLIIRGERKYLAFKL